MSEPTWENIDPIPLSTIPGKPDVWGATRNNQIAELANRTVKLRDVLDRAAVDYEIVGTDLVITREAGDTITLPLPVEPGPKGDPGAPGGSDEAFAGWIDTAESQTRAALTAQTVANGPDGLVWDALTGDGAATGDGTTDDTAALQARITAAAAFGATVLLGVHKITAALSLPSGAKVAGRNNESQVILPTGAAFAAFDIDGATSAGVSAIRVTREGATSAGAAAVSVRGNADTIHITDVTAEDLFEGFRVEGGVGTTPGICKQVILTRCVSKNANQYGFRIDETDGVELAHCSSRVSGLDGIKLRRKTKNVQITGGYYTGATGGDGLDAYAGGEYFTIQGTVFSGNSLNGVVIKNDDLNLSDPTGFGLVRNATLTGIIACDNGGSGLTIHRNGSVDDPAEPLVQRISVHGGVYNGNTNYGVFVNARQVSLLGCMAARNGLDGLRVDAGALDVDLVACHSAGNSTTTPNARDGIHVAGKRVKIWGGSSIGADPDGANNDAAVSAGTKTQRNGLRIVSTASACIVSGLSLRDNATAPYSDAALDTALLSNPADSASVPFLTMPNNQRIYGRRADGTLISTAYITTGGGLNFGDTGVGMSFLGASATFFPKLTTTASTASEAKFRLTPGDAPTSPVNGDVWATSTGLFIRINGVTRQVTLT